MTEFEILRDRVYFDDFVHVSDLCDYALIIKGGKQISFLNNCNDVMYFG